MKSVYEHKIHYYETDKMGITHHSNYIRLMEEARTDFLEKAGCSYNEMEANGIISPVVKVECQHKCTSTFDDVIEVETRLCDYSGVKCVYEYNMRNKATGAVVAVGRTEHCCIDGKGKPLIVRKAYPELDEKFRSMLDLAE